MKLTQLISHIKKIRTSHSFKVALKIGIILAPQLVLVILGFMYEQQSHALTTICTSNELVGAPVDPRYGGGSEVGCFTDEAFEAQRDLSKVVAGLTLIPSSIVSFKITKTESEYRNLKLLIALVVLIGIPIIVQLTGTYVIDNHML